MRRDSPNCCAISSGVNPYDSRLCYPASRSGGIEVIATGRDSWIGWTELKKAPIKEVAILNTGRVICDVNADILAVVEAENRVALKYFSEFVFAQVKGANKKRITFMS